MRLDDALSKICARHVEKTALEICGGDSISFGELDSRSWAIAGKLVDHGIQPGDRVGIVSGHDIDAVVLLWGILKSAAIVVWLNDDAGDEALKYALDDAAPKLTVVQTERQEARISAILGSGWQSIALARIVHK